MTIVTAITKSSHMHVVDFMAANAGIRRILIDIIDVATGTLHFDVLITQGKARCIVVKVGLLPATRRVAVVALFAVLTVMSIILLMAVVASAFFNSVVLFIFVAKVTRGDLVLSLEREIGFTMVEVIPIEKNNVMISPFVIGMAGTTRLFSYRTVYTVKTCISREIPLDTLMAF